MAIKKAIVREIIELPEPRAARTPFSGNPPVHKNIPNIIATRVITGIIMFQTVGLEPSGSLMVTSLLIGLAPSPISLPLFRFPHRTVILAEICDQKNKKNAPDQIKHIGYAVYKSIKRLNRVGCFFKLISYEAH